MQALPGGMAPASQLEPAIDQPREEGEAKESRSELLAGPLLFSRRLMRFDTFRLFHVLVYPTSQILCEVSSSTLQASQLAQVSRRLASCHFRMDFLTRLAAALACSLG